MICLSLWIALHYTRQHGLHCKAKFIGNKLASCMITSEYCNLILYIQARITCLHTILTVLEFSFFKTILFHLNRQLSLCIGCFFFLFIIMQLRWVVGIAVDTRGYLQYPSLPPNATKGVRGKNKSCYIMASLCQYNGL